MNILLVGSGGCEHALAWKLAQSPLVERLLIAPGNPGTAQVGHNVPVEASAPRLLLDIARRERVGLAIVAAPELLVGGLADAFVEAGIPVFGASGAAARAVGGRALVKQLLEQAGVPTPAAHVFDDAAAARTFALASRRPWVVKVDAAGGAVLVAGDGAAALAAIERIGAGGGRILLEQQLPGPELAITALCDGDRLLTLPLARSYGGLGAGDSGPAAMGAYAPAADLDGETLAEFVTWHLTRVAQALSGTDVPFRGALCMRVVATEHGPQAIDLQATFGDPELQSIVPLLAGDLLPALLACASGVEGGSLRESMLGSPYGSAACVVLAAEGYPAATRSGDRIGGVEALDEPGALVFQGATEWRDGGLATAGGRVLYITGLGATPRAAAERAYEVVEAIEFPGMQYRRDIGRI